MAPPVASGSGSKAAKLNPLESKLYKCGLQAPNGTIGQTDLLSNAGVTATATTMDAINSLLRKSLMDMLTDQKGNVSFRFVGRDEAKTMGTMESDEKLVFDQIKDSGNRGIWTKILSTKTGLPRQNITKALKSLESRKVVKTVKSVKNPTRKIYMLSAITPSVEMTGGPWFTDNELDTEFVDTLKKCARRYLLDNSIPDAKDRGSKRRIYPVSQAPLLPTVSAITAYISSLKVAAVDLLEEHVESLLDLMVYDGTVEKLMISDVASRAQGGEGKKKKKRRREESSEDESPKKKKKKTGKKGAKKGKPVKKKMRAKKDSDDDESEAEEEDDFDSDEDAEAAKQRKKVVPAGDKVATKRRKERIARAKKEESSDEAEELSATSESSGAGSSDDDEESTIRRRPTAAESTASRADYVYRLIPPYLPRIGNTDMPCGKCPSESFCTEPPRPAGVHHSRAIPTRGAEALGRPKFMVDGLMGVGMLGGAGAAIGASSEKWGDVQGSVGFGVAPVNPKDCHYFKEWLDF